MASVEHCLTPSYRDALILVAEDEPDNQAILTIVVETVTGGRVVSAANGREALAAVSRENPALILLDLMMPVLDGFEVARRLKADPATAEIPIIAISALVRPGDREEALGAGCEYFIRKPFDLNELEDLIRSVLGMVPSEEEFSNPAR